jgi:peptidoglycan/xylan/chitin deacetylase (PgdA/CDA1 family)
MYHRLTDRPDPHPYSLVTRRFRAHLSLLRALGCRTVTPLDVAEAMAGCRALPARAVVLTFDDGYRDTLELAVPILREFRFTATCFVVTDRVGLTSDWTEPAPLMGWADAREWLAAGMTLGSHSRTHPDLMQVPGDLLREEVAGSRAMLEDRLGVPVRAFAYPYNRLGPREVAAVRTAGYAAGCAGLDLSGSPHALCRVDGASDSLLWFLLRLFPAYPELHHLYRRLTTGRPSPLAPAAPGPSR